MSVKGFEIDSEFKQCDMRCEGVDRISQLPDDIIVHILSFLPELKEVVATSILSSRWLSLWKYNPNLVFVNKSSDQPINIPIVMPPIEGPGDQNIERSLKTVEWVNSVLTRSKAPSLKQFTISFNLHEKTWYQVSKWLHFAFSKQVEKLKLDLERPCFCLDINILSGIQSGDYKFLKELTVENLFVSGEAIEFLLRNCSVLERLILNAILTSDVVIGGMLKYLEIISLGHFSQFFWGQMQVSDPQKYHDRDSSICTAIFEVPELGRFQHDHLKVFEFSGFCDKAADHVDLVLYIANTCVALDEIIITPTAAVSRQFLLKFIMRARQFLHRAGVGISSLSYKGDVAEAQEALDMKKSTEQLLAGKLSDHIKLRINYIELLIN